MYCLADKSQVEAILKILHRPHPPDQLISADIELSPSDALMIQDEFERFSGATLVTDEEIDTWRQAIGAEIVRSLISRLCPEFLLEQQETQTMPKNLRLLYRQVDLSNLLQPDVSTSPGHDDLPSRDEQYRLRQYLYRIFPAMFRHLIHNWIDEVYQVTTPFSFLEQLECENTQEASKTLEQGQEHSSHALCDRTFLKLSCIWLWYTEGQGSPAFKDFDAAYRAFRLT